MSLKNNGIIDKATRAKNEYKNAQIQEEQYVNNLENEIKDERNSDIVSSLKNYSIDDIIGNKDDVLKKAFEDEEGTNYLLENYLQEIASSKEAVIILGESNLAYEKVMSNEEYFNKMIASNNMNYLDEEAKKIPNLSSNIDKGFILTGTEHSSYGFKNAFDGLDNTYWLNPGYGNATMYIEFPSAAKIYHIYYFLGSAFKLNYTPSAFEIYGVNNDGSEELISSGTMKCTEKDIYFYNNTSFSKYKIFFTAGKQGAGASILDVYYR